MAERNKTYFVSDLHLGAACLDKRESELRVVRWLDFIKDDACRLFLMGDILDYWYEYRCAVPKGFVRFFGKLAELSDAGVEIHWFTGNHDIWLFDYLPSEIGVIVHRKYEPMEIDGHTFFLSHGDDVGYRSLSYRMLQALFRNKVAQWFYSWIHPDLTIRFAHRWSSSSRKSHEGDDGEKYFRGERKEPLVQFAKSYVHEHKTEFLIFGHRHLLLDLMLTRESRMVILGDWINHCSYAVFDGNNLLIELWEEC